MSGDARLELVLAAKDLASKEIAKLHGTLGKLGDKIDGVTKSKGGKAVLSGVGVGIGAAAFGLLGGAIGGVASILGDSINAFNEDQLSQSKMRASLEANIPAWDGNTKAIEDVLASRMRLGFSDDEQRDSLATLVTRTHDATTALDLQRTAMDLARLRGMSLQAATDLLGKAYDGNIGALRKAGIAVDANATATEALAAVQKAATGQAEAYANTNAGKVAAAQIKVGEAMERVGEGMSKLAAVILPAVADAIEGVVGALDSLGIGTEQTMDRAAAAAAHGSESARLHLNAMKDAAAATANGWDTSTNRIVTDVEHMRGGITQNLTQAAGQASRIANALPTTIAKDLRGGYDAIDSASKALGEAMKNPIKAAAREKALTDILDGKGSAGKRLAAGLRSADPVVRQNAQNLRTAIQEELAAIREVGVNITATLKLKGGFKGGARAAGGPVTAGVPYLVGEEGPELVVPGSSGSVMNASQTAAMRGGGETHVHVYLDGKEVFDLLDRRMYRALRRAAPTGGRI